MINLLHYYSRGKATAPAPVPVPPDPEVFTTNPTALTWTESPRFRVFAIFNEQFKHYTSAYNSSISELTTVAGTAATQANSRLVVNGNSKYKVNASPKVNFFSAEMVIGAMPTTGTYQQLGPMIIKDAGNWLSAQYDHVRKKAYVVLQHAGYNSGAATVLMEKPANYNPANLKLTFNLMKGTVNFWAQENGGQRIFVGQCELPDNLRLAYGVEGFLPTYRYGVYTNQDAAGNHEVVSLRASANGGASIFNQRFVRHSDGKPYMHNGKYLITGDYTALATPNPTHQAYRYANQALFTFDINTFEILPVGHIYIVRTEPGDGTRRYYGGQDMKLTWYPNRGTSGQWLLTTVICDHYNIGTPPQVDDPYIWLEPNEPFTELVLDQSRFNAFNINQSTTKLCYDMANVLYKNGLYYVPAGETNAVRGQNWSNVTPILFTGPSLDNLPNVYRYATTSFLELVSWVRLGGEDQLIYQSFGENNNFAFGIPNFTPKGNLQISPPGFNNGRIGGFDFLTHQHDNITEYYLLGFDTDELTLVDAGGVSKSFAYSLGRTRVLKANQSRNGYEFPAI